MLRQGSSCDKDRMDRAGDRERYCSLRVDGRQAANSVAQCQAAQGFAADRLGKFYGLEPLPERGTGSPAARHPSAMAVASSGPTFLAAISSQAQSAKSG